MCSTPTRSRSRARPRGVAMCLRRRCCSRSSSAMFTVHPEPGAAAVHFARSWHWSHTSGSNSVTAPNTMLSVSPAGQVMERSRTLILKAAFVKCAMSRSRNPCSAPCESGGSVAPRQPRTSASADRRQRALPPPRPRSRGSSAGAPPSQAAPAAPDPCRPGGAVHRLQLVWKASSNSSCRWRRRNPNQLPRAMQPLEKELLLPRRLSLRVPPLHRHRHLRREQQLARSAEDHGRMGPVDPRPAGDGNHGTSDRIAALGIC